MFRRQQIKTDGLAFEVMMQYPIIDRTVRRAAGVESRTGISHDEPRKKQRAIGALW